MQRRPRPPPFYLLTSNLVHGCSFTVARALAHAASHFLLDYIYAQAIHLNLGGRPRHLLNNDIHTDLRELHVVNLNEIINYMRNAHRPGPMFRHNPKLCAKSKIWMVIEMSSIYRAQHHSPKTSNWYELKWQFTDDQWPRKWILHVISTISGRE